MRGGTEEWMIGHGYTCAGEWSGVGARMSSGESTKHGWVQADTHARMSSDGRGKHGRVTDTRESMGGRVGVI